MAMKTKKGKLRKGAEMAHLATALQKELKRVRVKLAEAEWLIRELDGHCGAEGWSEYLNKRLEAYRFTTLNHRSKS